MTMKYEQMKRYTVHVRLGQQMFADLVVEARDEQHAIQKAKAILRGTEFDHRFTSWMV